MAKLMCAKCGGKVKMAKMVDGGSFAAGIPYATGAGATDGKNGMMKLGGAAKAKLAGMAAPKNKITRADIIAVVKKKVIKKKAKKK